MATRDDEPWDWVVVGSGFGGSVAALRLVEKGYRVLLLEKGRRFGPRDFPRTNRDLRRWMWLPALGWRGPFRMAFFPHLTVVSGVGYGGGSLVYGNTLPVPGAEFFAAPSWSGLAPGAGWREALAPFYATARRMLGAGPNRRAGPPDAALREVARGLGLEDAYGPTDVAVFFGEAGRTVPDPYFDGAGPARTGCTGCGGCFLGCRVGAKNTLDLNYLHLAERRGLAVETETEVTAVRPHPDGGYRLEAVRGRVGLRRGRRRRYRARRVVLAGGVLGTVPLLLRMREDPRGLPRLSPRLGDMVRTNSEALIGVVSRRRDVDMTEGVAIGSILHTDPHSHIEPCRYPPGSDFFRLLQAPHVPAEGGREPGLLGRLGRALAAALRRPGDLLEVWLTPDWARRTTVLLYMRTLEGSIRLRLGRAATTGFLRGPVTALGDGPAPRASIPEASDLARRYAEQVDGVPVSLLTETGLGIPTTAHILGGCCMGATPADGVIDAEHRVHGYDGLYVLDGSAVSANPGVNPSLTITALAERAMSLVPPRDADRAQTGPAAARGRVPVGP